MSELYPRSIPQSIDTNDIESDVLTESDNDDEEIDGDHLMGHETPPRVESTFDGFSPLSGWNEFEVDQTTINDEKRSDDNDWNPDDPTDDMDYQSFDEEEENYKKFLQSVRLNTADENSVGMMNASFLFDEDLDEEDYLPDETLDEWSGDSDFDDEDVVDEAEDVLNDSSEINHIQESNEQAGSDSPYYGLPVRRKELAGLLGDCWLAIAGDNPDPTTASVRIHSASRSHKNSANILQSHSLLSSLMGQFFSGNKIKEPLVDGFPMTVYRKILARQMSMAIQLLLHILIQAEDRSHAFVNSYQYLLQLHNHRLNAVKKAALLQMNMETFLTAKQQQSMSQNGLGHGQTHMETRVIKQHQIQALMEEVAPHLVQKHNTDGSTDGGSVDYMNKADREQSSQIFREAQSMNSRKLRADMQSEGNSISQNRVLTRSSLINYNAQSRRSSSVLDVPILANFNELLNSIDQAQKRYKAQVLHFAINNRMATVFNNQFLLSDIAPNNKVFRQFLLQCSAMQLEEIYRSASSSKLWKSLIPTYHYPFPESFWARLDPTSIVGKTFLTPAEDDLMIRGLLRHGDQKVLPQQSINLNGVLQVSPGHNPWILIQRDFLPARHASLLEFHYLQKTSAAVSQTSLDPAFHSTNNGMFDFLQNQNTGNNIFKRFQWIRARGWIDEKRPRDRYCQHPEDINLLRGFQVFGQRWTLLSKLYLPHLSGKHLRSRWQTFLRLWSKTFPDFEQRARQLIFEDQLLVSSNTFDPHLVILESLLSPKLQAFLQDVQECSTFQTLIDLQNKGAGRHTIALDRQTGPVQSLTARYDTSRFVDTGDYESQNIDTTKSVVASLFAPLSTSATSYQTTRSAAHSPGFAVEASMHTSSHDLPIDDIHRLAGMTRVHNAFDFDHTHWGDMLSCDELSDEEENNSANLKSNRQKRTSSLNGNKTIQNGKSPSKKLSSKKSIDSDRDEDELDDSEGDSYAPKKTDTSSQYSQQQKSAHAPPKIDRIANNNQLVGITAQARLPQTSFVTNARQQQNSTSNSMSSSLSKDIPFASSNSGPSFIPSAIIQNAPFAGVGSGTSSNSLPLSTAIGTKRNFNEFQPALYTQSHGKTVSGSSSFIPPLPPPSSYFDASAGAYAATDGSKRPRSEAVVLPRHTMNLSMVTTVPSLPATALSEQPYGEVASPEAPPSVHGLDEESRDMRSSHMGIEELLGFSNFTRDMSRIRAEIIEQEQEQAELLQQQEEENKQNLKKTGEIRSVDHSRDGITPAAGDTTLAQGNLGAVGPTSGLFASVMRGAK